MPRSFLVKKAKYANDYGSSSGSKQHTFYRQPSPTEGETAPSAVHHYSTSITTNRFSYGYSPSDARAMQLEKSSKDASISASHTINTRNRNFLDLSNKKGGYNLFKAANSKSNNKGGGGVGRANVHYNSDENEDSVTSLSENEEDSDDNLSIFTTSEDNYDSQSDDGEVRVSKRGRSGRKKNVTVSYTYDAFFISDGRSRKRNINGSSVVSTPTESKERTRYTCTECGKHYATSSNLSRHKQTHRSPDSQLAKKCPTCHKVYVSMPALAMHVCQFRDLNEGRNAFQRKFVIELRRCVEMERKLGVFEKEITRDNIPILKCKDEPQAPSIRDVTRLESQLDKLEKDLIDVNNNRIILKRRLLELTELRAILKNADQFFAEATSDTEPSKKMMRRMSVADASLMRRFSIMVANEGSQDVNIPLDPVVDMFTFTGTILTTRFNSFERMLWRVSRGNILLRKFDIEEELEDPETGETQKKVLFILVFQGEKLQQTCLKILDGFRTNVYPCPEKAEDRRRMYGAVMGQINDMMLVIEQSDDHRSRILVAAAKNLKQWMVMVAKMKGAYEVLNCFLITDHSLIGECWIPDRSVDQAKNALVRGQQTSNSTVPSVLSTMATTETPPTLNVTNKFSAGYQMIIDAYGVSNYGEVNPAPFAIITFPFIFAVMFGDTGHGIIMTLFALWMVWKERQLASVKDEIFSMFYGGRYIILLMGLFSMYTGLIYNDIFSKSINLFGSSFSTNEPDVINGTIIFNNITQGLIPYENMDPNYVYWFGIDPVWQLAQNKVIYLNTYKMKVSVILGVLQMFFGVVLSLFNHIHFRKPVSIMFEFIPQLIFLIGIFGYMDFMIIWKWFNYSSSDSAKAPSVLITLINMFMFRMPLDNDPPYLKEEMFDGQYSIIQPVCLILAVVCIPIMLIVKPVYNHCIKKSAAPTDDVEMKIHTNGRKSIASVDSDENGPDSNPLHRSKASTSHSSGGGGGGHDGHDGDGSFGDAFINQAIHTIEYCLGSVSHTASYLRLWALSLAHAQLSEVLWNMVMKNGFMEFHHGPPNYLNIVSGAVMFVVFSIWAVLTVAILIVMEGLSAFLHALRLHWVEFMSKFYSGAGIVFMPFSFRVIIDEL